MRRETENEIIEYDIKTAIFRISILILILFFIYIGYNYFFNSTENEIKELNLELIEIREQKDLTFEYNSRGEFKSMKENIFVQGEVNIDVKNDKKYISITGFKVTNNKNLVFYLSTNVKGSELYKVSKLSANIGSFEYGIPMNIDTSIQKFLLIRDESNNENYAYAELRPD